ETTAVLLYLCGWELKCEGPKNLFTPAFSITDPSCQILSMEFQMCSLWRGKRRKCRDQNDTQGHISIFQTRKSWPRPGHLRSWDKPAEQLSVNGLDSSQIRQINTQ
ncbi:hypothetical protein JZ751_022272, partial [Albula glossodonta]